MTVSIITVCFNSVSTVEDTIKSVLNQSFKNIEYIIVDGLSDDGTVEIIKKYSSYINTFISEPDNGIYEAMNKGIQIATGDVIGILNSDDVFYNNEVLTKIARTFKLHDTDLVYGNIVMSKATNMTKALRKWIPGQKKSFLWGWHPPHPGLFVKKNIYEKYGLYNTLYNVSADFDLMLRLFEVHKVSFTYLNEFIVNMRMGGESTGSLKNILKGNINIRRSFKANKLKYLWIYPYWRIYQKLLQYIVH